MKTRPLYCSEYFTVSRIQNCDKLELEMMVHSPIVNTKYLKNTVQFIESHCPGVLTTDCFNDLHLPFRIEVKETEIAHLLEHIVLDELCALEISKGADRTSYSGNTSWNWIKEPRGTFHIQFDLPKEESLFFEALSRGMCFIEQLFQSHNTQRAVDSLPAEYVH